MTPEQARVWARYHTANEMLADATEALIIAEHSRRAGFIRDTSRAEEIARGLLVEYRAARAAVEAL